MVRSLGLSFWEVHRGYVPAYVADLECTYSDARLRGGTILASALRPPPSKHLQTSTEPSFYNFGVHVAYCPRRPSVTNPILGAMSCSLMTGI